MLDFGISELMVIGVVALVVIGPERLPRVARTVGHMVGKAQRYVADVKSEVNRSMELEELRKVKTQFEDAARDAQNTMNTELQSARSDFDQTWGDANAALDDGGATPEQALATDHASLYSPAPPPPGTKPRKNWRLKRGAVPTWYKQREGVRRHTQSGAARVARFRPPRRP